MKKTYKPADIIGDCIKYDKAKKELERIDENEITRKAAEIFTTEKREEITRKANAELDTLFKGIFKTI